jgi:hypothetical protein
VAVPVINAAAAQPTGDSRVLTVPTDVIAQRKKNRKCFKCGRKGHFAAECRTGWRRDEPAAKLRVNTVAAVAAESSTSGRQGKETSQ